jgi:thiol-disulfide isomerase/thioredoxin
MRRLPRLFLSCCLSLLLVAAGGSFAAPSGSFSEISAGELLKRIADESGKVVVVNVFASWCPPCREEIPGLINIRRAFSEKDVVILGISVDREPRALGNYMNELKISYPVMLAKGDFIERVGVVAVPQLLIYDKKGELALNHKGLLDEAKLRKAITEILAR